MQKLIKFLTKIHLKYVANERKKMRNKYSIILAFILLINKINHPEINEGIIKEIRSIILKVFAIEVNKYLTVHQ